MDRPSLQGKLVLAQVVAHLEDDDVRRRAGDGIRKLEPERTLRGPQDATLVNIQAGTDHVGRGRGKEETSVSSTPRKQLCNSWSRLIFSKASPRSPRGASPGAPGAGARAIARRELASVGVVQDATRLVFLIDLRREGPIQGVAADETASATLSSIKSGSGPCRATVGLDAWTNCSMRAARSASPKGSRQRTARRGPSRPGSVYSKAAARAGAAAVPTFLANGRSLANLTLHAPVDGEQDLGQGARFTYERLARDPEEPLLVVRGPVEHVRGDEAVERGGVVVAAAASSAARVSGAPSWKKPTARRASAGDGVRPANSAGCVRPRSSKIASRPRLVTGAASVESAATTRCASPATRPGGPPRSRKDALRECDDTIDGLVLCGSAPASAPPSSKRRSSAAMAGGSASPLSADVDEVESPLVSDNSAA